MRLFHLSSRPSAALRRRGVAALVVAIVLVLPGIALATHQFADVPTSYTFHDDIDDLYGARIGTGCGGGNYCPNNSVTRGQMAGFLNRGLGRVDYGFVDGSLTSGTEATVGSVTVRASNPSGGAMFVQINATANVYQSVAGCPCEVLLWVEDEGGNTVGTYVYADLPAIPSGDNDADTVVAIVGVTVVPTGVDETFTMYAQRAVGTGTTWLYGDLTAQVIPFDGDGDAASLPIMLNGARSTGK